MASILPRSQCDIYLLTGNMEVDELAVINVLIESIVYLIMWCSVLSSVHPLPFSSSIARPKYIGAWGVALMFMDQVWEKSLLYCLNAFQVMCISHRSNNIEKVMLQIIEVSYICLSEWGRGWVSEGGREGGMDGRTDGRREGGREGTRGYANKRGSQWSTNRSVLQSIGSVSEWAVNMISKWVCQWSEFRKWWGHI